LFNTQIDKIYEESMSESDLSFPPGRYKVIIGSETDTALRGMSIKEFKVWSSLRSDE
jgi:hypothetical protein